ncbi:PDC sensor domain-containing protein, partial [Haemophilus parainfluenzae]|uniref:PDC sensor domain-containing protein n=1 Tax=Haemophilus parainfluenzae TaxID=729 RepID=UPI001CECF6E8
SQHGAIQFSDLNSQGQTVRTHPPVSGWVTQTRPWYRAAVETGKPVWGEIFPYHAYPVMAIPASVPLYDATGKLLGVMGNNVFLSQLS